MTIKKWGVLLVAGVILSACANTQRAKPLYAWGHYEPSLYAYFKGDSNYNAEYITKLEADIEKAGAKNETVAPGVYAHLGLLYASLNRLPEAKNAFNEEKRLHPDSAHFMNFLMTQKGVR